MQIVRAAIIAKNNNSNNIEINSICNKKNSNNKMKSAVYNHNKWAPPKEE